MLHRLATEHDVTRLAELIWEHYNEYSTLDPIGKAAFVHAASEHMKHRLGDDYYCWVTDIDGIIVTHIHIIITRKLPKPRELNAVWGRLSTVRTIPEYRNKGIGTALINKVKEWCKEQQLEELVVWPSEQSVSFYERAGFKNENDVMEMLFE